MKENEPVLEKVRLAGRLSADGSLSSRSSSVARRGIIGRCATASSIGAQQTVLCSARNGALVHWGLFSACTAVFGQLENGRFFQKKERNGGKKKTKHEKTHDRLSRFRKTRNSLAMKCAFVIIWYKNLNNLCFMPFSTDVPLICNAFRLSLYNHKAASRRIGANSCWRGCNILLRLSLPYWEKTARTENWKQ